MSSLTATIPGGAETPDDATPDVSLRRGLLIESALQVLAQHEDPLPGGLVLEQVAELIDLTDQEKSLNKSGNQRYDTFIRFATGWMKAIGWMEKTRELGWSITAAGREALAQYDGDELYRLSSQRYREVHKARKAADGWTDPRWQVVRDGVAAVPEGFWTTYGDLSALADLPARAIGTFLAENEVPGAHRVLNASGSIADGFRWNDPDRTDDPRLVLEDEGLEFDAHGHATATQRLTAEDLREIVGAPAIGTRVWLVRGSAVSGVNVVNHWLADAFVSLAASHLRPLESGVTLDELRAAVEADYAHLSYNQRRAKLAELHAFLNRMTVGDVIVTTSEGKAYLGRVAGPAAFTDVDDTRTTIRRDATWEARSLDFADLPDTLKSRLRSSATVVDLTDVAETVEALIKSEPTVVPKVAVPEVQLPNLPTAMVEELLVGEEWLHDFVDLLRTRRQVIVHGPPGTGKTYLALEVANALTDPANVTLVQFHPAYSYEDFFEGYRPTSLDDSGRVGFALTPGPFRKVVDRAREDPGTPYVLIIDEINRANLAKVFGELYFLLEYRDRSIDLMYGSGDEGRDFTLPKNVYVIGTMNTADRSIALVDSAMRRRFAFLSLHPDDSHLRGVLRAWLERRELPTIAADLLDALNARIEDRDFKVGPSYLMRPEVAAENGLERIWRTSILPLLEELHYGDPTVDVARRYGLPTLRRTIAAATESAAAPGITTED